MTIKLNLSACLAGVSDWMRANRLQLNTSKTEILWCTTSRQQHRLSAATIQVGTDDVLIMFTHRRPSVTWVYTLTVTSLCVPR